MLILRFTQATTTSVITTVLSSVSCFGLAAMSTWFGLEYLVYTRYDGRTMWLSDLMLEEWAIFLPNRSVAQVTTTAQGDRSRDGQQGCTLTQFLSIMSC